MSTRLYEHVADEIGKHLAAGGKLPANTIGQLAQKWQVSYPTMQKAVRILLKDGVVRCFRGGRVVRADDDDSETDNGSIRKICDLLKERILGGHYEVGNALPKFDYFTLTEHVSRATVTAALRLLADENLVHKAGKQWRAGPAPKSDASTSPVPHNVSSLSPVVLLALPGQTSAHNFFSTGFTLRFVQAFTGEAIKYGIELQSVFGSDDEGNAKELGLVWGIEQARDLVARLGNRYQGALIHTGPFSGMLDTWPRFLCSCKKPVVYFDSTGVGRGYGRINGGLGKLFHNLYFDETSLVRMAMEALWRAGHRTVAIPTVPSNQPDHWSVQRCRLATRIGASMNPPIEVVTAVYNEPFWDFLPVPNPEPFIPRARRCKDTGGPDVQRMPLRRWLRENTPSITSMLDKGATAFLCANDAVGHECYRWCKVSGIDVPKRVSLVSFDNATETLTYPLSTIDPGFGRLGYLAAHVLVGDIPVRTDREGGVAGRCTLVDRGSIGQARA